ncbi:MAG: hypothetical protein ACYSUQ_06065 [Planctomycetota bacterium]|jgi:uncharacterized membrane protein
MRWRRITWAVVVGIAVSAALGALAGDWVLYGTQDAVTKALPATYKTWAVIAPGVFFFGGA